MTASINFLAGFSNSLLNGSGLAFYAGSYGASISVGNYQSTTWVTDSVAGTVQGEQAQNIQYLNSASGIVNSASSGIPLLCIPNSVATLHAQFQNDTIVKTQNIKLRMYDGISINNPPSSIVCAVAELIHPSNLQSLSGSGSSSWQFPTGSSVIMNLTSSPGLSGQFVNGPQTSGTIHDMYLALSASPSTIGKHAWSLYLSLEYL